uniref:hypothetical protein n=1 Tax=Sinorhizobium sp. K101 TaxID=2976820 RepID=UPI0031F2E942
MLNDSADILPAEARQLGHEAMISDGEAVVLDEKGRSNFGALQRALAHSSMMPYGP